VPLGTLKKFRVFLLLEELREGGKENGRKD